MTKKKYSIYINRGYEGVRSILENTHGLNVREIRHSEALAIQERYDSEYIPFTTARGRMTRQRLEKLLNKLSTQGRFEVFVIDDETGEVVSRRTNGRKLK